MASQAEGRGAPAVRAAGLVRRRSERPNDPIARRTGRGRRHRVHPLRAAAARAGRERISAGPADACAPVRRRGRRRSRDRPGRALAALRLPHAATQSARPIQDPPGHHPRRRPVPPGRRRRGRGLARAAGCAPGPQGRPGLARQPRAQPRPRSLHAARGPGPPGGDAGHPVFQPATERERGGAGGSGRGAGRDRRSARLGRYGGASVSPGPGDLGRYGRGASGRRYGSASVPDAAPCAGLAPRWPAKPTWPPAGAPSPAWAGRR